MFVGQLSHPNARQTNVAADSDRRLAFARRRSSPLNLALCASESTNIKIKLGENELRREKKEQGWLNLLSEEIYKNISLYAKKPNNIGKIILKTDKRKEAIVCNCWKQ